jgi:putative transposase
MNHPHRGLPWDLAGGGYHEIQGNRRRNRLLALDVLAEAAEAESPEVLARGHREWIEETLCSQGRQWDDVWTKSLAVDSEQFVLKVQENLGVRGKGRGVFATGDAYVLRESPESYKADFDPENRAIAPNIGLFGDVFS